MRPTHRIMSLACLFAMSACVSVAEPQSNELIVESGYGVSAESDPARLGWMKGNPPPGDKLVRFSDGGHYSFPRTRWSFSNLRQLMPSAPMSLASASAPPLQVDLREDLDDVTFTTLDTAEQLSWSDSLAETYTDAVIVLHKGKVVYERYFGVTGPETPHISFSVTKSYFGTLAEVLIANGDLDPSKLVSEYVPELAGSGFGDATVRQLTDMTTGIKYSEDYSDPDAEVFEFVRAGGFLPRPSDYRGASSYYEFLPKIENLGTHGDAFSYKSVNTEVLGWVIGRATGLKPHEALDKLIWQSLGAQGPAYFLIDETGAPFAAGGFNAVLRDHARFGEAMRNKGKLGDIQIFPRAAIERIHAGGDPAKFEGSGYRWLTGWSYVSQWWHTQNENGAFMARGVHGQAIYIDPAAEMVVARFGSHPMASNQVTDPILLPAYAALANALKRSPE